MSEPVEIVRIPFHGTEVIAVDADGQPHIVLKPALETIGVDFSTQRAKLVRRSWACVGQRPMQLPGDTQSRLHMTVDVRTFLMLLATIDENRVPEDVRPLLVAYQREVADVIESYWTKGAAVQPGVEVGPQHEVPQTFAAALRLAAEQLERAEQAEKHVAELEPKLEETQAMVTQLEPKARYVDTFVGGNTDATLLRVVAGQLNVPERALRRYLMDNDVIYRRNVGSRWSVSEARNVTEYQELARSHRRSWFVPMDQPKAPPYPNGQMRTTLYVTPIGKVGIQKMLARKPMTGGAA